MSRPRATGLPIFQKKRAKYHAYRETRPAPVNISAARPRSAWYSGTIRPVERCYI